MRTQFCFTSTLAHPGRTLTHKFLRLPALLQVYKGLAADGTPVAVKLLPRQEYRQAKAMRNEIEAMRRCSHPHVVQVCAPPEHRGGAKGGLRRAGEGCKI